MEGGCLALRSGFGGDSCNTEGLPMATYSFGGRFSSGRKAAFPSWHEKQGGDVGLSNGGNAHPRHIREPSVQGDGRSRAHPQAHAPMRRRRPCFGEAGSVRRAPRSCRGQSAWILRPCSCRALRFFLFTFRHGLCALNGNPERSLGLCDGASVSSGCFFTLRLVWL